MNTIELSQEERNFFVLVAAHLKEKGLTQPEQMTQTNVKQAMREVREQQIRLTDMFCNNEEFSQAVVVKMAKAIWNGTSNQASDKESTAKNPLLRPKPLREEEQLYDFCLSDDLNEKLKTAICLLDEIDVELRATKEDYLEPFLYELKQGTHRLVTAIRGLDQDPIV